MRLRGGEQFGNGNKDCECCRFIKESNWQFKGGITFTGGLELPTDKGRRAEK